MAKSSEWERRAATLAVPAADSRIISGVAMRYGDTATLRGGLLERFLPGAFEGGFDNVLLDIEHDRRRVLARHGANLELADSPEALRFKAELPATRECDDALTLVRSKIAFGSSIEFRVIKQAVRSGVRIVERAVLRGIGVTADPAYGLSLIEARFRDDEEAERQLQAFRDIFDTPAGAWWL